MTDQTNSQMPMLPEPRHPIPPAPIHPLAALATIVLDSVFALPELAAPELWPIIIPLVGGICFLTTTMVQRYLAKDSWGASVAKGLVMGIIAGVPFPVTSTAIGIPLLAWAGLHEWVKLPPPPKSGPEHLPAPDEIVDAEVKDVK
ncbi:MAG: hypothetical protein WCE68_12410 [Anaerolineales bacterium]